LPARFWAINYLSQLGNENGVAGDVKEMQIRLQERVLGKCRSRATNWKLLKKLNDEHKLAHIMLLKLACCCRLLLKKLRPKRIDCKSCVHLKSVEWKGGRREAKAYILFATQRNSNSFELN